MKLLRRDVLGMAGMGVLMPAIALADDLFAHCTAAIQTQLAAQPAGPCLLNSYIVETGPDKTDFDLTQADAAYVYDNALAGMLLLAAGDTAGAARIGSALAIAQAHDRFYKDGRLRNAYQAGPMAAPAKLPGFWDEKAARWNEDPYQAGSQTGPIAWAMRLWAALGMKAPANLAGDFLDDRLRARTGYYGGFHGFEPHPVKLTWQSTEQNTDCFVAFKKLVRAEDAAHAEIFVRDMFNPESGLFNAGLAPDGARNPLLAADAGIWPYLARIGSRASAQAAIAQLRHGEGIGFSAASSSIWLEGTAFAALALGNAAPGPAFLATLAENTAPNGYLYATITPTLATGLTTGPALTPGTAATPFNYYRRPALSTTAWAGLAAHHANPLA